jgi:glyoxylate reductase
MKRRVLITRGIFPEVVASLSQRFEVEHNAEDHPWPPEELVRRLAGKAGAMATVMDKFDEAVLAKAPDLKVISNIAVGYNNIDVAACTRRGIRVTNTPGVLDDTTADLTWSLLMAAARRIAEGDAYVRAGDWKIAFGVQYFLGQDIHHATLGIIGMGRIGQAVARRARAFGLQIHYHNRRPVAPVIAEELGATYWESLDQMLARMDIISVNCPHTPATFHLLSARRLKLVRKDAYIVNTARGEVIDEETMTKLIESGDIAGAGLDVFEHEPAVNPKLLRLARSGKVVLLPHMGSATIEGRIDMGEKVIINIKTFMDGHKPPDRVLPSML